MNKRDLFNRKNMGKGEGTNNLKFFLVGVLDLCFRVLTSLLEGQNTGHEKFW